MCIFSAPVDHVRRTRIFARREGVRQLLAYEMAFTAPGRWRWSSPSRRRHATSAVELLDLASYPDFFEDLAASFPVPVSRGPRPAAAPASLALAVHRVGAFDASFVPDSGSFGRLDPRFRLTDGVLDALPRYADWSFLVFALHGEGEREPHPMAFSFATRDPRLYFPTTHVHSRTVPADAAFDHQLYWQSASAREAPSHVRIEQSGELRVDVERARGLVDVALPARRFGLRGLRPNVDVWLS